MRNKKKKAKRRNRMIPLVKGLYGSRAFRRFAASVLVMTVVIFSLFYLYGEIKQRLSLRSFVVIGNTHLSDEEVVSLMKIKHGVSLLDIDSALLEKQLLRSAWIKRVLIRKELPHTLIVKVKEARPVAILRKKKGLFLVDREGRILERLEQSPSFLPILELKDENPYLYKQVLILAQTVRRFDYFNDREVEIIAHRPEDISLKVDGLLIKVGKGRYREKLEHLVSLKDRIESKKIPIEYIDLRFKKRVIIRPSKRIVQ